MALVSVGMPVHNAAPYVERAIRSILEQDLQDFELIVIDDGSTDQSWEIVSRLSREDGRIQAFHREQRGIVATRNELLARSCGRFFAMMDADDWSARSRFRRQVALLSEDSRLVLVNAQVLLVDPEGAALQVINRESTHEEIDGANLRGEGFFVANAYMGRRDVVMGVGGFRPEVALAEDRDLFLRLAEVGRLGNVPEILYFYRQHQGSICSRQAEALRRCVARVVRDAHSRRGLAFSGEQFGRSNGAAQPESKLQLLEKWGWWALGAGNVSAARRYALRCLARAPWSTGTWRLAACALRGH